MRTFATANENKTSGVQLSWFRASALQAEGRRFESVNAHFKFFSCSHQHSFLGVQLSWFRASALQAEGRRFESVNAHFKKPIKNKFPFRAFSSAGSEHLPYKQRVGGSNPSTPTPNKIVKFPLRAFSSAGSEHLPYKQRVGGSNPSTPTSTKFNFSP